MADVGSLGTRLLRIVLGLCALVLVLLALYVSLGRQLVPLVAEYRQQLEDEAGKQLGIPVRIAELTGSWRGFEPLVVARDIQVGDGEQSLRLARVRLAPDLLGSLLARQVRIGSLELEGLKLTLREGEDGQWSLDGLPHSDKPSDPRKLLQFLLQTQRISLLDSQLEVAPRGSAALSLSAVGATLRSSSVGGQSLDARLQLPDGQPLALHAEGRIDSEDWPRSSARFYLSLPQSDWAQWLPAGLTQEWKIVRAKAGGDFWFDWRDGKAQRLVARLLAPQLKASYAARKPVEINDLGMNLFFDREAQGWKVRVGDLAANFGEQRWGEVELLLRRDQQNNEPHWKLQADRVDLTPLVPAIEALAPLPDAAAEWVAGLKPKGILHNLNADFWPQREVPERVSYATNLEKVGISAFHEVPAVENVSGTLTGTLAGGQLDASAQDFMLHLAKVFPEPWRYREARTRMFWSLDDRAFTLGSHLMRVEGEEGRLAGDMLIRLMRDPGAEDYMDLQVGLSDGDARFTAKYLPTQLPGMNKSLANWLKTAIRSGHVEQGYFQWQGSLNRGAAAEAHVMNLYFKVRDGELAYQPGWPALSKTVGEVFVEDSGVRVLASSGNLLNSRVSDVKVDIPLGRPGQTPHLYVDGAVDSNLKDGIKLLQEAPIPTRKIFAGWEGDGPLQGHLKLDIPLDHDEAGKNRGGRGFLHRGRDPEDAQSEAGYERSEGRLPVRPGQGPERPGGAGPGAGQRGTRADRRRGARRCAHALAAQRPGGGQVAERLARRWPASVAGLGTPAVPAQPAAGWQGQPIADRFGSQGRRRRPAGAVRQDGRPGAADPMADDPGWRRTTLLGALRRPRQPGLCGPGGQAAERTRRPAPGR